MKKTAALSATQSSRSDQAAKRRESNTPKAMERVPSQQSRNFHLDLAIIGALALTAVMLMPFMTSVNDFLAVVAQRVRIDGLIAQTLAPAETRMLAVAFTYMIGMPAIASGPFLTVTSAQPLQAYVDWNCTGWQSWVVLGVTMIFGMRGHYARKGKMLCIALGVLGTFAVNLFRISTIVLIAIYVGSVQALLYHVYGGIIVMIVWLFIFWYLSFRYFLMKDVADITTSQFPFAADN